MPCPITSCTYAGATLPSVKPLCYSLRFSRKSGTGYETAALSSLSSLIFKFYLNFSSANNWTAKALLP